MAKTLKDLLFALLNATLILVALCLFLGLKLAQSLEGIRDGLKETLQEVAPLRDQAQGIRGDLTAIRSDLVSLREQDGAFDSAAAQQLTATLQRLNEIELKLEQTQARLAGLADKPDELIDYAITTSADALADRASTLRGCEPAT